MHVSMVGGLGGGGGWIVLSVGGQAIRGTDYPVSRLLHRLRRPGMLAVHDH